MGQLWTQRKIEEKKANLSGGCGGQEEKFLTANHPQGVYIVQPKKRTSSNLEVLYSSSI